MNRIIGIAVFAIASLFLNESKADTIKTATELLGNKEALAYVFSHGMLESMYRLGVEQDKKFEIQTDCKSQYQVNPVTAIVLKPIEFTESSQNPKQGAWLARYQMVRCGESKVYNALFITNGQNGETPSSKAFYPGSTYAGLTLVNDAMIPAMQGAMVRANSKECKKLDVFDMRVTEVPHNVVEGDKTFKGVWKEIWTFKVCEQTVDVPITFTPDIDGGGTSFHTDAFKPDGN